MAKSFPVWYFWSVTLCESLSKIVWALRHVTPLFPCCLSIRPFEMIPPFQYFAPKLFCFSYIRLLDCLRTFCVYLLIEFSFVVSEGPVLSVVFIPVSVFSAFLLPPVPSELALQVVYFVAFVLVFPLCHKISYFSSDISPLLVVVDVLSVFQIKLPIPV